MTRQEQTNNRDLTVSKWIRAKLPDSSTGFLVSDLDFILYNWKTQKLMLLEVKQFGSKPRKWQKKLFAMLHKIIYTGVKVFNAQKTFDINCEYGDLEYLGFHLITVNGKDFSDGVLFDNIKVTESELIARLSF